MRKFLSLCCFTISAYVPFQANAESKPDKRAFSALSAVAAPGSSADADIDSQIREPLDDEPRAVGHAFSARQHM